MSNIQYEVIAFCDKTECRDTDIGCQCLHTDPSCVNHNRVRVIGVDGGVMEHEMPHKGSDESDSDYSTRIANTVVGLYKLSSSVQKEIYANRAKRLLEVEETPEVKENPLTLPEVPIPADA